MVSAETMQAYSSQVSFYCILFTPARISLCIFERSDDFNIISILGLPANHIQWLLGDFLVLLAGAADEEWYSPKKHSGNPTQQGELSTEVSRLFLETNN